MGEEIKLSLAIGSGRDIEKVPPQGVEGPQQQESKTKTHFLFATWISSEGGALVFFRSLKLYSPLFTQESSSLSPFHHETRHRRGDF